LDSTLQKRDLGTMQMLGAMSGMPVAFTLCLGLLFTSKICLAVQGEGGVVTGNLGPGRLCGAKT
jgi:hypothetical protein